MCGWARRVACKRFRLRQKRYLDLLIGYSVLLTFFVVVTAVLTALHARSEEPISFRRMYLFLSTVGMALFVLCTVPEGRQRCLGGHRPHALPGRLLLVCKAAQIAVMFALLATAVLARPLVQPEPSTALRFLSHLAPVLQGGALVVAFTIVCTSPADEDDEGEVEARVKARVPSWLQGYNEEGRGEGQPPLAGPDP